jgi:hypothetical protein
VTWVLWNLVSVRLEIVLVSVKDRCMVCAECTVGSKSFWTHPMVLQGKDAFRLDIELILTLDRCMVCAEHTTGSDSFWTHPMVLQGDDAQVEARFVPFGHRANLDAR